MHTNFKSTGSETTDRLISVQITGNIIPVIWYKTITHANGKPDTNAISLLSDIVYWYRPMEKRDETTGQMVGYQKKYRADKLQRSYRQIMELYGFSRRQAELALNNLCRLGVVTKEFRTIEVGGQKLNNVMYLDLNVDKLLELTYPNETLSTSMVTGHTIVDDSLTTPNGIGTSLDADTNTEITTENTEENTSYQIDARDEIEAYTLLIKENIEYEILKTYLRPGEIEAVDEMVDIMVEAVVTNQESMRIGKREYPYQLVKSRLLKITREHIDYVIESMDKTPSKIKNMKAYLLATLFNAPTTMANHYRAEANYDMYG